MTNRSARYLVLLGSLILSVSCNQEAQAPDALPPIEAKAVPGSKPRVSNVAPLAPVVATPANGSRTNDTTPTCSGTAEAASTVTVIMDGTSIGTTVADAVGIWSFTPVTALPEGTHTVQATATDAGGGTSPNSNTNTFTVDASAPASPVVIVPPNGSVTNDSTPTCSGTAEAGSTATVIVDGALVGTTMADASGNWSFTLSAPLVGGAHTVRATATDAAGNTSPPSNTNTFTMDTAPVANNDSLTVAEDSGATVLNVLANDSTSTGTLTITAATQPANATVTLIGGVLRFTPASNFFGTTSFTYTISDGGGGTSTATVMVTVTPVNDPPDAANDTFAVASNSGATALDVLANDSSAPDQGETLTITAATQPANGTVTLTGGVLRFTPAPDFSGTTSFTYTVSDGNGGTDTATVTVTVTPVGAPTAVDDSFTTFEDSAATVVNVLANDTAASGTLTITAATQPANGTVTLSGGVLEYTPAANFSGTTSFTYTISDGSGGTDTALVTVTVTPVNDPPTVVDDTFTVTEDSGATVLDVLANDSTAPDTGETLTVVAVTQPTRGTVTLTGGVLRFTNQNTAPVLSQAAQSNPTSVTGSALVQFSVTAADADGDPLTYAWTQSPTSPAGTFSNATVRNPTWTSPVVSTTTTFTMRVMVSDSRGGSVQSQVNVEVAPPIPANNPPTITAGPTANPTTLDYPQTTALSVTASDPDSDPLTYAWTQQPASPAGSFSSTTAANPTWTPPQVATNTTFALRVIVSDGRGGSVSGMATVSVNETASPATSSGPMVSAPSSDEQTAINFLVNTSGMSGSHLTPALDFSGITSFTYTVSDGNGGTAVALVTVIVTPTTNAPNAVNDSFTVADDSAATVLDVLVNDSAASGILTITTLTQPANGTVTLAGGVVRFTPAPNFLGTTSFTYTISDGSGGTDTATATVTVRLECID